MGELKDKVLYCDMFSEINFSGIIDIVCDFIDEYNVKPKNIFINLSTYYKLRKILINNIIKSNKLFNLELQDLNSYLNIILDINMVVIDSNNNQGLSEYDYNYVIKNNRIIIR